MDLYLNFFVFRHYSDQKDPRYDLMAEIRVTEITDDVETAKEWVSGEWVMSQMAGNVGFDRPTCGFTVKLCKNENTWRLPSSITLLKGKLYIPGEEGRIELIKDENGFYTIPG